MHKNLIIMQTGFHGNYTHLVHGDANEIKTHMVKFNIKTPLDFLKDFRTSVVLEIEGNLYNATVSFRGEELIIDVSGKIRVNLVLA